MKLLEEMDSIYSTTISKLPRKEKIAYCENLIDRAQFHLVWNKKHLNKGLEEQLYQIMRSAQAELAKLLKEEEFE